MRASVYILELITFLLFVPHNSEQAPPNSSSSGTGGRMKISRGVYYTAKVPSPVFYTSVAAITYEFKLPDWATQKPMIYDQDCPTDEISETEASKSYTCPTFHYIHKVRDELLPLMQLANLDALPPSSGASPEESFDIGRCPNIKKHFHTLKTTSENLETYKKLLQFCVEGRLLKHSLVLDYNQALFKFPYTFMMSNFLDNYFKLLPAEGRTDLAILLNSASVFNNLAFTQALAEAQRWKNAMFDCKLQNIPSSLISPESFAASLEKLNQVLSSEQLEPVLSSSQNSSAGQYYQEKLTDCVLTDSNTLFVRVMIPLKQVTASWKYLQVKSVPFLQNKSRRICYVEEFTAGKNYATELYSKTNVETQCEPEKERFCLINNNVDDFQNSIESFRKTCASTVFIGENRRGVLNKFCPMVCEDVDFFHLPIFTRLGPDKFVIVGLSNDTVVVEIDSHVNIIPLGGEGAIEVTLPCKGVIKYQKRRFYTEEPCGKVYKVIRVEPVQWGESPVHSSPPVTIIRRPAYPGVNSTERSA